MHVLQNDGSTKIINDRDEINKSILTKTQNLFEEINKLPITNTITTHYIGKYSQNQGANDILQNNINANYISQYPYLKEYLQNLDKLLEG